MLAETFLASGPPHVDTSADRYQAVLHIDQPLLASGPPHERSRRGADGGETKLENLISLCKFHHGLVHEDGFTVELAADGAFVFRRPDGERLPETGRLDRATLEALAEAAAAQEVTLRELNRKRGLAIDADTARCRWAGEQMDYHLAVGSLIQYRDAAQRKELA